jgi:hypothetical protein
MPPDSSTELFGNAVAGCPVRATTMGDGSSVHVFAVGSYNSAEARITPPVLAPPVTSTYPPLPPEVFASHVAVCPVRGTLIGATIVKLPFEPYISAVASTAPFASVPPETSTAPPLMAAAAAPLRACDIAPVNDQLPVGLGISDWAFTAPTRLRITKEMREINTDLRIDSLQQHATVATNAIRARRGTRYRLLRYDATSITAND